MPEFHAEPYLFLAGLTHKSALIAWGAFYFRVKERDGDWKLVDDSQLDRVHPPRRESFGARSPESEAAPHSHPRSPPLKQPISHLRRSDRLRG